MHLLPFTGFNDILGCLLVEGIRSGTRFGFMDKEVEALV